MGNRINPLRATSMLLALSLASLAACGPDGPSTTGSAPAPTPSPTPTPTPTSTVQYTTTAVPFQLTANRTFDVFGWDYQSGVAANTSTQLRWNAATTQYEVLANGSSEWAYLRARTSGTFDAFNTAGTQLPFQVQLSAPTGAPSAFHYVGEARVVTGVTGPAGILAFFAFGFATAPGDLPTSGSRTCSFGEDEVGGGTLAIDFAARTVTGHMDHFYAAQGGPVDLTPTTLLPAQVPAISTSYGTLAGNLIEARFFGPQGADIAVRLKGEFIGVMIGTCT
jgi:hypothetical protein